MTWQPDPSLQDWATAKRLAREPQARRKLALGLARARLWRFRPTQTPKEH